MRHVCQRRWPPVTRSKTHTTTHDGREPPSQFVAQRIEEPGRQVDSLAESEPDLCGLHTLKLLHEIAVAKLRLDGTPTPRSWVARMTKRSTPTGDGKSASHVRPGAGTKTGNARSPGTAGPPTTRRRSAPGKTQAPSGSAQNGDALRVFRCRSPRDLRSLEPVPTTEDSQL